MGEKKGYTKKFFQFYQKLAIKTAPRNKKKFI